MKGAEGMYARVTTGQIQPDKIDDASHVYRESIVSAMHQAKGFKNLLVLTDRATGTGLVISVWETEADMKASESSGHYQQQAAKLAHLLVGAPSFETYEVTVQE
jgi:quinol monooxygenase YgiN